MKFETLTFEVQDHVGVLTISRPKALNSLNSQVIEELYAFAENHQETTLRCLIITGAGNKAFVAGADIKEMSGLSSVEAKQFAEQGQKTFDAISRISCPVVAAVNGFALGGGMELALACDVVFASNNAKFGLPEVTLGLIPGFGGTQRLTRTVGLHRAREMILSGDMYAAKDLERMGLVSKIVDQDELLSAVTAFAQNVAKRGPVALKHAKRVTVEGYDLLLSEALKIEADAFAELFGTKDTREGTSAFIEKRKPAFEGC